MPITEAQLENPISLQLSYEATKTVTDQKINSYLKKITGYDPFPEENVFEDRFYARCSCEISESSTIMVAFWSNDRIYPIDIHFESNGSLDNSSSNKEKCKATYPDIARSYVRAVIAF